MTAAGRALLPLPSLLLLPLLPLLPLSMAPAVPGVLQPPVS
jgi:hypothetical protein